MPLPMSRPYFGFQSPFHELSFPNYDNFDPELACDDDHADFNRINHQRIVDEALFVGDDATSINAFVNNESTVYQDSTEFLIYVRSIEFRNITTAIFNNIMFNKLRLERTEALSITADGCVEVPLELLKCFVLRMPNMKTLELYNTEGDSNITQILTLFPKLEVLKIPTSYEGWIQDLLTLDSTQFELHFTTVCKMHSFQVTFDPKDVAQLFKQKRVFLYCTYSFDGDVESVINGVADYMGKQFTVSCGSPRCATSELIITFKNCKNEKTTLRFFLQPDYD